MKGVWLGRLLKNRNIDHIYCHWAGCSATMAWAASLVSGVPWSMTAHRWDIFANNLLCQKARSACFVRFISNDGVNLARGIGLETLGNVHVIHMGVSLPATYSTPAALPLRSGCPIILCAANLVPVKGHTYLFTAFNTLRRRNIDCELWLAGDGPLRAALETQVKSLGLEGKTRFLGSLSHARLLALYEQGLIAMVVLPSLHEGIPVSLMEAMSFGVPVISTRTGGTAELVGPQEGILVPPADPEALASAMETLLADPTHARLLAEAGRRKVLTEFSAEASVTCLLQLFERHRTPTQDGSSQQEPLSIAASSG
jgi:glycosyltransferase involved in cell wall biosynthesis